MINQHVKFAIQPLIRLLAATSAFALCSCVSPYNAQSHKNLTDLKAYHLKFVDTFTAAADTSYSSEKVKDWREKGDLYFRQAETYSATLKDASRTQNFIWLHEDFTDDAAYVLKGKKLLSETFADQLKKQTTLHYDAAIRGEKVRDGAPE